MRRVQIGEQIRAVRKSRGLTQEEVALAIGLDRAQLVRIERAQADPRLSTLIRLGQLLRFQVVLLDEDLEVVALPNPPD